jgi:hypothetical protein
MSLILSGLKLDILKNYRNKIKTQYILFIFNIKIFANKNPSKIFKIESLIVYFKKIQFRASLSL